MIERYHTDILQLQQSLEGSVSFPGDPDYLETKSVFNAHVDKNPAIVIFPASIPDILRIMEFAGQKDMRITIRNGGHSTYGQCLIDDGLVLNMKNLNRVVVDPVAKIARVEAGALLRDLDMACAPYHLAVPAGDCPMVGVAGLVLGGGNGFLSRSFGLTCDQLVSAGMVTADGQTLELSNAINAKLFRAIKGAGQGNFGVITELVFRLSEVPESIYGGSLYWPASIAREILLQIDAPDAMSLYVRMILESRWVSMLRGQKFCMVHLSMQRIMNSRHPYESGIGWKAGYSGIWDV
jgi:FAD/FMN-containing dehydrogenase